MNVETCIICESSLKHGIVVTVMKRGIKTLIGASTRRKDGKHEQLMNKETVAIHGKCQKSYTHPNNIDAYIRRRDSILPRSRKRSYSFDFEFEKNCIFCGKNASESFLKNQLKKKNLSRQEHICQIRENVFRDKIVEMSYKRADKWSDKVMTCIASKPNLVTAKARYHSTCYARYFRSYSTPKNEGLKRIPHVLDIIQQYIEDNPDEHNFSLNKIVDHYAQKVSNNKWPKRKLYEKLGNEIIITSTQGANPIFSIDTIGKTWENGESSNTLSI